MTREELASYLLRHGWKEEGSYKDLTMYLKEGLATAVSLMDNHMSYERTEGDDKMIAVDCPYGGFKLKNECLYCYFGWGYVRVEL